MRGLKSACPFPYITWYQDVLKTEAKKVESAERKRVPLP